MIKKLHAFPARGAGRIVGHEASDVTARLRKVRSEGAADRIRYAREHDRNCLRLAGKGADYGRGRTEDRIGLQIDQLFCQSLHPIRIIGAPAKFDLEIAAFSPPQLRERTPESCEPRLRNPIALRIGHQHADQPHPARLLPARRERPGRRRAAEQRDELAAFHSITSSARVSSVGGTSRPSAWAVLRLMNSSIFVACWTGKSAGFSPLRTRPV